MRGRSVGPFEDDEEASLLGAHEYNQNQTSQTGKRPGVSSVPAAENCETNPLWHTLATQPVAIQAKLSVNQPYDPYEQEADQIAAQVTGAATPPSSHSPLSYTSPRATINRSSESAPDVTPKFQSQLAGSRGGGHSLEVGTRREMESRMGADLSAVKVHTGSNAHEMNRSIDAKAFALDSDVYFRQGEYSPHSTQGKQLLAHELVHTVQQKGAVQRKIQRYSVKEGLSDVLDFTGVKSAANTVMDVYHFVADSDEDFQQYVQAQLKSQIEELEAATSPSLKFKAAYYGLVGFAAATNPMGAFMMPSVETLWSIHVKGKLGYYTHLYNLGREYITQKNEQGKTQTVKNKDYQKGGYAKSFGNQLKNLVNPMFAWGEVKGLFKGIGKWFTELWEMIEWLGSAVSDSVKGTWNLLVHQKVPPWMTALEEAANSASEWLDKNAKVFGKFIGEMVHNPDDLKSLGKDLTAALKTGSQQLAYSAGAGVAKQQVSVMNMSAEEQGEKLGTAIGYLIPEVVIAIFTDTILNWIKAAVKALKATKLVTELFKAARWVVEAFEKLVQVIKRAAGGKFAKLGEMFDDVVRYFKGLGKVGEEAKLGEKLSEVTKGEKKLVKGESKLKGSHEKVPEKVPEKKPHPEEKKKPTDKELEKREKDGAKKAAALLEAKAILVTSNATHGSLISLETQLAMVDAQYEVVKGFEYRPDASGLDVYMIASEHKVGHKNTKTPGASTPTGSTELRYEGSPKHTSTQRGNIAAAPTNGQATLERSLQVKVTSPRRIGVDSMTGEFVVFDQTTPGVFHAHVRMYEQLTQEMKDVLIKAGQVTRKGRILGK